MESADLTTLLVPIISGVLGGIAWLAKYILNRRDENQKRIFAERDRDKQAIKDTIEELKTEVKQTSKELKTLQALIVGCEHEDCPNRQLLKDYLLRKEE